MTLPFEPVSDVHKSRSQKNQLGKPFPELCGDTLSVVLGVSHSLDQVLPIFGYSSKWFSPKQNKGPNMFLAIPNYRRLGTEDLLTEIARIPSPNLQIGIKRNFDPFNSLNDSYHPKLEDSSIFE